MRRCWLSIAEELGDELLQQVAFVGGATITLHLDDAQPMDIRSTKDIDFVVSVASYLGYQSFIERLKSRNFVEYIPTEEESPICRYKYHGIMVDVMPDDETVLGFSNPWFKRGLANALWHTA